MFRCVICHRRFDDRASTVNHARARHSRDYTACRVVTLSCSACGLEFLTVEAWRAHKAELHGWWTRAREREWSGEASWPTAPPMSDDPYTRLAELVHDPLHDVTLARLCDRRPP
jgi:hypothetical protein